jgi:hypothetical protein
LVKCNFKRVQDLVIIPKTAGQGEGRRTFPNCAPRETGVDSLEKKIVQGRNFWSGGDLRTLEIYFQLVGINSKFISLLLVAAVETLVRVFPGCVTSCRPQIALHQIAVVML